MVTQVCGNTATCTRRRIVPRGRRVVDHKTQPERREKGRYARRLFSEQQPNPLTHIYKEKPLNKSLDSRLAHRWAQKLSKKNLRTFGRTIAPSLLAISLTSLAHAQGTVDFSGATTAMNAFKTFAEYAGAVICLGCLIFAGIRLMSGRFQDAIPGLFGALFGAGVLGWGAGWISSLTGQSVTQ
jgi:TrbC/VIRB2 pilin